MAVGFANWIVEKTSLSRVGRGGAEVSERGSGRCQHERNIWGYCSCCDYGLGNVIFSECEGEC
jgi:hypothetical protein